MRTVQNWEGGVTPVPDYVDLVVKRELQNIDTPYFVNNTPKELSIVSKPGEDYGLKKENLDQKKAPSESEGFYKDLVEHYKFIVERLERDLDFERSKNNKI